MGIRKRLKLLRLWFSRKSYLPLILVGGALVALLYFDEETSVAQNIEYTRTIKELNERVKAERDSAEYYRRKKEDLMAGKAELEYIAREQYHMQKATEDVFLVNDEGAE